MALVFLIKAIKTTTVHMHVSCCHPDGYSEFFKVRHLLAGDWSSWRVTRTYTTLPDRLDPHHSASLTVATRHYSIRNWLSRTAALTLPEPLPRLASVCLSGLT
eukprot:1183735-Amphidinium_carterae.1